MYTKNLTRLLLIGIIFLAAILRLHGLNWDQGYNLHPDERAIIMTVLKLQFPIDLTTFLSPSSPWNPNFFAYGSFPFYLLYFISQLASLIDPRFTNYDHIALVGRFISSVSEIITIIVLFLLGRKLFNTKVGLLSAFFYSVSVLPIQLSHFYAVDSLLNLFILLLLYQLIVFYENPSIKKSLFIGITFGLALATKVSAIVLATSIGISLMIDFIFILARYSHKPKHYLSHLPSFLKNLIKYASVILLATLTAFVIIEPYALIDFQNFWLQTLQQHAMTKDAFTFPYTLQYVGKIPYAHELKNIFFFGLGPVLTTLSLIGMIFFIKNAHKKELIILAFFFTYFLIVGNFAIGFMRYMLPLYPIFCLFAALAIYKFFVGIKNKNIFALCALLFALCVFIWPLSFIQIYSHNNTRTSASMWIHNNIPPEKMILVEHWDDRLPLYDSGKYLIEDLELYNPDTDMKWQKINDQLNRTDYLIVASNRLYTPLQKLTNCNRLPLERCYAKTAFYYRQLFSERLNFKKVAEFSNYPVVPFFNIKLNDISADESFTVYDHPKIMIFKKVFK